MVVIHRCPHLAPPIKNHKMYTHIPVLLKEAISYLDPKSGMRFVDATLGGGGYTQALLDKIQPGGAVLAIDLDAEAIANAPKRKDLVLAHGNFRDLDKILEHKEFYDIDGIVADIGLSSYQLDQSGRGITFQKKEVLDMRFDQSSQTPDARHMLNHYPLEQLIQIFRDYGEEKESKRIAQAIIHEREVKQLHYTTDLTEIIERALPKPIQHRWKDSARRIFQALRVAVNHELDNLEAFLPKALDLVKPGGRIAIVSFHSLEDRIVKDFFTSSARGCICPIEFPICQCGRTPRAKILTKKPITADAVEASQNSRSLSAKLRVIEKIN